MPDIQLTQGTVHYRDEGEGPAVVFIHGLLVNGRVWDDVMPHLGTGVRRIVPDLPLGSHPTPMNDGAALDPPALARMIAELIERLDLQDVTLVGNDTGGALCQLVVAHHPERIGKLLLINCDAFENFPPRSFAPALTALRRVPGLLALAADLGRARWGRRLALKFAPLTLTPIRDELAESWLAPLRRRGIRRDAIAVMRGIVPAHTLGAVDGLRRFDRPAIVLWGLRDVFFAVRDGERLVETLPRARLETVSAARTFVQLDAPDRVFASLCDAILTGRYAPGERLPTQRTLAAELGVNMASVRSALGRLEQLRLVEVRHGDATRVLDWRRSGGLEALAVLGSVDPATVTAPFEARRLLLTEAARLAAQRRTDKQAERLDELAGAIAAAGDDGAALLADWSYMSTVIEASGNLVLQLIMNSVRELYLPKIELFAPVVAERESLAPMYRRAAEAIGARAADAAAESVGALARAQELRMAALR